MSIKMHKPPHPGEIIRELCLVPLDISVSEAARSLGVSRVAFSRVLNGQSGISPEMAIRLSRCFGGSSESWLKQQMLYDLDKAEKNMKRVNVPSLVSA